MNFLGIDSESEGFKKGLEQLYGSDGIGFHDARFDVCWLVMVYYKAIKLGYKMWIMRHKDVIRINGSSGHKFNRTNRKRDRK